jgi:hypothetical protein
MRRPHEPLEWQQKRSGADFQRRSRWAFQPEEKSMIWITCTDSAGKTVYINFGNATRFEPKGDGAAIYFIGGLASVVKENPTELMAELARHALQ